MTPLDELASIEGFDENIAAELQRRAEASLAQEATALEEQRVALGVSDEVASIEALSAKDLVKLGEKGVKSLDDLADLAGDELIEIVGAEALTEEAANEIIMAARAHWFEEDGNAA
jgi:N utilization substance protein A